MIGGQAAHGAAAPAAVRGPQDAAVAALLAPLPGEYSPLIGRDLNTDL